MKRRALLLVLDSLGIGHAPDAADFGDEGSNTLGHIAAWCARPITEGGRGRSLSLPNLRRLGLGHAAQLAGREPLPGLETDHAVTARWGCARERSTGKDTVSGHWEMMGLPVDFEWGYFRQREASLPAELVAALADAAGCAGILGNCHASGTEIIQRLGSAHLESGWPIVYTSADSVLQIAAHEERFGLERLYSLCARARVWVDRHRIGRVIARPFAGDATRGFVRTGNRHDYAVPPTAPTLLDRLQHSGGEVIGIGKIPDIFAGRGIDRAVPAHGLDALLAASRDAFASARDGALVFTNLVDFDQEYGHRRDVAGYAAALEHFDTQLPALLALLGPDDLLALTADHGNDPTWPGNDHTREQVPLLLTSPSLAPACIGSRDSFADLGQSLAHWFGLPPLDHGRNVLP